MLEHGGRLHFYSHLYRRPVDDWLDLSTGINPTGWPVADLPASVWSRLPDKDDGLTTAAQTYYQTSNILPVAGSQAAIQLLPALRSACSVGIIAPAYAEHRFCWQQAGHRVLSLDSSEIQQRLPELDVLIIVNPNNPTGELIPASQLLQWHAHLSQRGGWLIVDEAFIDVSPANSLASHSALPNLIILRSLGKFFGLAGLRVGFVLAATQLLEQIEQTLGPWPIATASRYLATRALQDTDWQQQISNTLQQASLRLDALLRDYQLAPSGGTALYKWIKTTDAAKLHDALARRGVLTRLFENPPSLRFGLPGTEQAWAQLDATLAAVKEELHRVS